MFHALFTANPMPYETTLTGNVEKIFATYGFVAMADGHRYFFHFGTCASKPELLKVGDWVEFVLGEDIKTHRIHAQKVRKIDVPNVLAPKPHPSAAAILNALPRPTLLVSTQPLTVSSGGVIPLASIPVLGAVNFPCSSSSQAANYFQRPPTANIQRIPLSSIPERQQEILLQSPMSAVYLKNMQHSDADGNFESNNPMACNGQLQDIRGIVLMEPKGEDPRATGIIACEIDNEAILVHYRFGNLRYGAVERPLMTYGMQVTLTAVFNNSCRFWFAKDVVPVTPVLHGKVVDVVGSFMIIEQSDSTDEERGKAARRFGYPLGSRLNFMPVNTWVEFVLVPDERVGHILSRVKPIAPPTESFFTQLRERRASSVSSAVTSVSVLTDEGMPMSSSTSPTSAFSDLLSAFQPMQEVTHQDTDFPFNTNEENLCADFSTKISQLIPGSSEDWKTENQEKWMNTFEKARCAWYSVDGCNGNVNGQIGY